MQLDNKQAENKVIPLEQPENGIFEAYANAVDADWTLTDVTIRFLQLGHAPNTTEEPTTMNRELTYLEKANITLPWWQAKLLSGILADLVRSYESLNGVLATPKLAARPEVKPSSPPSA